jgi:hypothetical protein
LISHPELSTRKKYSVREILDLTGGQYGNARIREFFEAASNKLKEATK